MLQFLGQEGEQIVSLTREKNFPAEARKEVEKIPGLLLQRAKNWEERWTVRHQDLQRRAATAGELANFEREGREVRNFLLEFEKKLKTNTLK